MRTITTGLVAAGLLVTLAGPGAAESNSKQRRYNGPSYHAPFGGTERQLRNLRAYERGEYYERDSNALPVGSRAWFEQKERESGDRR